MKSGKAASGGRLTKGLRSPRPSLAKEYYDPDIFGAYKGFNSFKRGRDPKKVKEFLKGEETYSLHFPLRKKFPRRRVVVSGINSQFQTDLLDLQKLKKENDGYGYVLTCIDVFSKYAWAFPIHRKTGAEIIRVFKKIFGDKRPLKLQSDLGVEFLNRPFQQFLKKQHVEHFHTYSEMKASIVERFNRTLKSVLWRYFTANQTLRYVDVLPKFVHAYNHTYHRAIDRTPASVTPDNQEEVWQRLYPQTKLAKKSKITEGTRVRISKTRRRFDKSALPNWTRELFTVSKVDPGTPLLFHLTDANNETLRGRFYAQEIQPVDKTNNVFMVEQVLKRRKRRGRVEHYVKWLGYPSSFNSWVNNLHLYKRPGQGNTR